MARRGLQHAPELLGTVGGAHAGLVRRTLGARADLAQAEADDQTDAMLVDLARTFGIPADRVRDFADHWRPAQTGHDYRPDPGSMGAN